MISRLNSIVIFAVGAVFAAPATRAAESYDCCAGFISSLPVTITTQGVWCLDRDLCTSNSAGPAVTIATNNVTVDCNGFKIGGLGAGPGTAAVGVSAMTRRNVSVRHCNIRGFRHGIAIEGLAGSGHVIEDNQLEGNTQEGIRVFGETSTVRGNRVLDTGGTTSATYFIAGIHVGGTVDVEDNLVGGMAGTPDEDIFIYGILSENRGHVVRNQVRELVPSGTEGPGSAAGIALIGADFILVERNEVDGVVGSDSSRPIYCSTSSRVQVRDNLMVSYPNGLGVDCNDLGGNVYVP